MSSGRLHTTLERSRRREAPGPRCRWRVCLGEARFNEAGARTRRARSPRAVCASRSACCNEAAPGGAATGLMALDEAHGWMLQRSRRSECRGRLQASPADVTGGWLQRSRRSEAPGTDMAGVTQHDAQLASTKPAPGGAGDRGSSQGSGAADHPSTKPAPAGAGEQRREQQLGHRTGASTKPPLGRRRGGPRQTHPWPRLRASTKPAPGGAGELVAARDDLDLHAASTMPAPEAPETALAR